MVYYLSILFVFFLLCFVFRNHKDRDNLVVYIGIFYIFLFLACRGTAMCSDLVNYDAFFTYCSKLSFKEIIKGADFVHGQKDIFCESGYCFLCWAVAKMGLNYQAFLILSAAFCALSFLFFIRNFADDPVFSLLFLICIGVVDTSISTVRQVYACSILLFATGALIQKKHLKFLLLFLLAATFHRTVLAFAVVYPLSYIKLSRKTLITYLVVSLAVVFFVPLIYDKVIVQIINLLEKPLEFSAFEFREIILIIVAMIVFLIVITDFNDTGIRDQNLFWAFAPALPLMVLSTYVELLSRTAMEVFFPYCIIFVPNIMKQSLSEKNYKRLKTVLEICLVMYFFFLCFYADHCVAREYKPFWAK